MRTIIVVVFLMFGSLFTLSSQNLMFVAGQGLGSFKMSDLKTLNQEIINSLPFDAKITENFPLYLDYKASLEVTVKNIFIFGVTANFQSTGSRISRTDYSGEYSFDNKISSLSEGLYAGIEYPLNKLRIAFRNEAGMEASKLLLLERLSIGSTSNADRYSFISLNWYYEPSVSLSYPVLFFRVGLDAGYLIDFKRGALKGSDSNNIYIKSTDGKIPTADWSGIRLNATVSFNILHLFKPDKEVN